jgi:hypothetical protein
LLPQQQGVFILRETAKGTVDEELRFYDVRRPIFFKSLCTTIPHARSKANVCFSEAALSYGSPGARADFFIRNEQFLLDYAAMGQLVIGHMDDEGADPELGKVLLELNAAADGQENIKLVLGDVRSAKAASGGTKRKRNSADLAAGSESVLREFLKRGPSSNVSQPCA